MKKLQEELGRNYHTLDNDPIPFDYDNDISVSTIGISDGQWEVTIKVGTRPDLNQPSRRFSDEQQADLYAQNKVQAIKNIIGNQEEEIREYVSLILRNNL